MSLVLLSWYRMERIDGLFDEIDLLGFEVEVMVKDGSLVDGTSGGCEGQRRAEERRNEHRDCLRTPWLVDVGCVEKM